MTRNVGNPNNIKFHEVAEISVLKKVLSSFSKATGLRAFVVDPQGETLVTTEENQEYCNFCNLVRSSPKGVEKCKRTYAQAGLKPVNMVSPIYFDVMPGW